MLNDAGVAILGGAEHISTETEDKFTHMLISSIGVLQIMETHSDGKTTSQASIVLNRLSVNQNFR
jgi:hypothetical protein